MRNLVGVLTLVCVTSLACRPATSTSADLVLNKPDQSLASFTPFDPIGLQRFVGPGRKGGGSRKFPGGAGSGGGGGGSQTLENPDACTLLIFNGQSSSVGFCDAGGGAPYTCGAINTAPLPDAWMPCWNGDVVTGTYDNQGLVALDQDDSLCRRYNAEQPARGMVDMYRQLVNPSGDTFTCWPGMPGASIDLLSDPARTGITPDPLHWARLESCIDEVIRVVGSAPDPQATYGCDGTVVVRGMGYVQGEGDEGSGTQSTPNNDYTADVLAHVDDLQTMIKAKTGQTSDVVITWDQPSNWFAQSDSRSVVNQQLLEAANQRDFLHVIHSKGHVNTSLPCNHPGQAMSFEYGLTTESGSTLHWSPCWNEHNGNLHGKWIARLVPGALPSTSPTPGLRITSAVATGSDLRVCWNVPYPPMVRDTTICPDHWNGNDGFEIVNVESPGYFDGRLIAATPSITSFTQDGSCIDFVLSHPPYDGVSRFEVGYRGLNRELTRCWGSATVANGTACVTPANPSAECGGDGACIRSNEPEHGCRDFDNVLGLGVGGPNIGAAYTKYRDSDPLAATAAIGAPHHNWMLSESFPITGGIAIPPDTSDRYIAIGDTGEWLDFPDETPDVFAGDTAITVSVWIDTNNSADGDLIRKWATLRWFYDNRGTAGRLSFNVGTAGVFFTTNDNELPLDSDDFIHYALTIDLSEPNGAQAQHYINCEPIENDVEGGTAAAAFIDTADQLQFGGAELNNSATVLWRDMAIWDNTVATQQQIMEICRSRVDVTATTLGAPAYFVRPGCNDDISIANGVVNLGSVASNGTGNNHEAGDIVTDGTCP